MASKGPRSKIDHETRAKRQKALEAPREPRRPKTHWDHVLEEMVWLSKDFESERKWKLAQAKKVALRASKGMVDQATRGERKLKEEEQRLKKIALNISKDVKKFWTKIEKLVLYKHQMELDEKKKKALDKQLEFLLGQTERYSTMLAENLVDACKPVQQDRQTIQCNEVDKHRASESADFDVEPESETMGVDEDYDVRSEDDLEDDEHTVEEDEALITAEERQEELTALQNEVDLPLEELLERYDIEKCSYENREIGPENSADGDETTMTGENHNKSKINDPHEASKSEINNLLIVADRRCSESNGVSILGNHQSDIEMSDSGKMPEVSAKLAKDHAMYDFNDEHEDGDFVLGVGDEKDDETTLAEEEELAKADSNHPEDEIALLQKESEIPIEELLSRYKKDSSNYEDTDDESDYSSPLSEDLENSLTHRDTELKHKDVCTDTDGESEELQPHTRSPTEGQEPSKDLEEKDGENIIDADVEYQKSPQVTYSPTEEQGSLKELEEKDSENIIEDAAAVARSAQPTGNTFSTTKVRTKFPFLLKHPLREYQHIGLDWLVTMYEKRLNGILADEMGLGKTIMTISLLAHLACEKGIWSPHLIVVPTSVMLNWETEFLKWCPAFKILTYFGSAKERKFKRQGWLKPNSFHVCITTYRLVIQDSKIFKRKKWKYLILDEAHLIKNWKSQRWQTLLNFNSKRRILLTGTPLQNDLMELWSLMHFLMPHIFQSHQEFKDWFSNPISGMVEGQEKVNKEVVDRLHNVLRPFILRRLKRDVEKQLPMKHEHVVYCRLSRRQRNLYEDFIASSETQTTLASSNFFGMISVIMQLRKVCNHPDLFEGRPIVSSFDMSGIDIQLSSSVCSILSHGPFSRVNLKGLGLLFTHLDFSMTSWESAEVKAIATPSSLIKGRADLDTLDKIEVGFKHHKKMHGTNIFEEIQKAILEERVRQARERTEAIAWWNSLMCDKKPIYSTSLRDLVTVRHPVYDVHCQKENRLSYLYSSKLAELVLSPVERFQRMIDLVESFMFAIPAARAPPPVCWCSRSGSCVFLRPSYMQKCSKVLSPLLTPFRPGIVRRQVYFPDRRLIQFDCGKLQELAVLLRRLKSEGHRALIFTQMTKMLDILEAFINLYGYTYMRLDGSTQPEERQTLMQRFNTNPKFFLFILSTRSGGVGINLVGADTVIFYDSDWNPAMDNQAQDRCHRIGQTREVHIYRLISESTIEENILKKAKQKRALDDLVIQSGGYNTEFFKKLDPMELFSGHRALSITNVEKEKSHNTGNEASVSNADLEAALKSAEDEADYMALKKVEQEEAVDNQEFTEEALGRMEEDEFINEDDMKVDEPVDLGGSIVPSNKDNALVPNGSDLHEERALAVASNEDDVDMLADVKQMAAAAAAAGHAILSFENQLRPIDRFAIRFLEMWDPIIDKAEVESQVKFEEAEWELDRIEKYKEEMEAEVDEDEEPLVYESWDADFATEAYRRQVETLAQLQLMEELENEAKEKEDQVDENYDSAKNESDPKPKSKKKPKKAKFKSLKKGSIGSQPKSRKEEPPCGSMLSDDDLTFDDIDGSLRTNTVQKKRKKSDSAADGEEEKAFKKKSKKLKKSPTEICPLGLDSQLSIMQQDELMESKPCESAVDLEHKPVGRSRTGGKISITAMPLKRVLMIKPERLKKGNIWSRDCVPSPDSWLPQEDAILCAMVHEYGPHWSLVSDSLYGMTAGGFYRGRYRHPAHCCERYRELIQRYVLSAPDHPNNEKTTNAGSGKALLKVTEDNIRMLLDVAAEQPDREFLLQKHFTALLVSVWKAAHAERPKNLSSSRNGLCNGGSSLPSGNQYSRYYMKGTQERSLGTKERTIFTNSEQSSKLLAAAIHDVDCIRHDERVSLSEQEKDVSITVEQLDLTLEFQIEDEIVPLPSVINLSVSELDGLPFKYECTTEHLQTSQNIAENRFRAAAKACAEDSPGWASFAFPTYDVRSRSASKSQSLGKHKSAISDLFKPAKLKYRKTAMDQSEIRQLADAAFTEIPSASPDDLDVRFSLALPNIGDVGVEHTNYTDDNFVIDTNFPFGMNEEDLSSRMEDLEMIPDYYTPDWIISGLDDCSILPEFADIG